MISVNVSLYGSLARFGGGHHVAQVNVELESGAGKTELLDHLEIPENERGYLFINAVLCEVPGISTGANELLKDGDHIGIFSIDRLYPYQYRDGLPISDGLRETLKKHGAMHHSYR
jgi:molybdopterin converting factor small subunit